jgi:hypothetical protein
VSEPYVNRLVKAIEVYTHAVTCRGSVLDPLRASGLADLWREMPDHITEESDHLMEAYHLLASVVATNQLLINLNRHIAKAAIERCMRVRSILKGH